MRNILLALLGVFLASGTAWGVGLSEPHHTNRSVGCASCHSPSADQGPHGTVKSSNFEVCRNCHNDFGGKAGALPFDAAYKSYTVGISGAFHKWDVYTSNSTFGASAPTNPLMLRVITEYGEGKITCSVCHNQHGGEGDLRKVGRLRKTDVVDDVAGTGPKIEYDVVPGADAKGWYVEIVDPGDELTATFVVSEGKPHPLYWRGYNTTSGEWVNIRYAAPKSIGGAGIWHFIDNGNSVRIKFAAGSYSAGQRWRFYYAYPLLRAFPDTGDNNNGKKFCRDCHEQRAQTHYRAGNVWDGEMKSHPVGVSLNANGGGYDRKPLDVDGVQQGTSSDANSTNDLLLFQDYTTMLTTFGNLTSGDVQCMTCHAPHWTDSNSQTVDLR